MLLDSKASRKAFGSRPGLEAVLRAVQAAERKQQPFGMREVLELCPEAVPELEKLSGE